MSKITSAEYQAGYAAGFRDGRKEGLEVGMEEAAKLLQWCARQYDDDHFKGSPTERESAQIMGWTYRKGAEAILAKLKELEAHVNIFVDERPEDVNPKVDTPSP
jgi:hypothetical protein